MDKKILISAYNINSGGGKELLLSLLRNIPEGTRVLLYADSRLIGESLFESHNIDVKYIKPSIFSRFIAEWSIWRISKNISSVLCLGNLPPLFNTKKQVFIFLHSRYLLDEDLKFALSMRKHLLTLVEKLWLLSRLKKSHSIYVQTPTMLGLFKEKFGVGYNIDVAAFLDFERCVNRDGDHDRGGDFIYVASYDDHKNHMNLIKAWKVLRNHGHLPILKMVAPTVPPAKLLAEANGLNIQFIKNDSREELLKLYSESKCLIHPSFIESFGIVLLEAKSLGLDILAPELDYVRDLVEPRETFDPASSVSIARSVMRYLKINTDKVTILSPGEFWLKL